MCKVRARLALLLRFYSVFRVWTVLGPLGLLGGIFGDLFMDFIAFVKNAVRETAVRVHIGVQKCGKKPTF